MRTPSFLMLLAPVLVVAAPVAAVELPSAEVIATMADPIPARVRITVTKDAIMVRPRGGTAEKKVTSLENWTVAATDLSEGRIQSLSDALEPADQSPRVGPPPPENGVDGWAELWIDRAAPYELVSMVTKTAGRWLIHYALAVKTPSGDRTVSISLPVLDGDLADDLVSFGVEAGLLYSEAGVKPVKASPAAVRKVVAAFEKSHAKGRPGARGSPGAWVCPDGRATKRGDPRCWRGQVGFSFASKTPWGEAVPLVVAAQTVIPEVFFSAF